MATVKAFIRTTKKKAEKVNIRFRLTDGRNVQLFHKSEINIDPNHWDKKTQSYKSGVTNTTVDKSSFNLKIAERKKLITTIYEITPNKEELTTEKFNLLIDQALRPEKYLDITRETIFEAFDRFLKHKKISKNRRDSYKITKKILKRYELFVAIQKGKPFILKFDYITPDMLEDLESFIRNEHELFKEYPEIYKALDEKREPQQRGHNRIVSIFSTIRSFILWAIDTERMKSNPFKKYKVGEQRYGTPIYITKEERNQIYKKDLSKRPGLQTQRDIFIFQCLTGMRVGDFYKLTPDNIINDGVEYIASKTKDGRPVTVRVPLNDTAKEIIERYKDVDNKGRLFPFISTQKYNEAIKEIFKAAEVTRIVIRLNPKTSEPEKIQINKIASSHMARRTFAGNLYKKVQDPNLVGSLTGHKEGSKAFARYRDIDEDIKRDLIKHLD